MGKLANLETNGAYASRKVKIKNVISFLIKQLNEGNLLGIPLIKLHDTFIMFMALHT